MEKAVVRVTLLIICLTLFSSVLSVTATQSVLEIEGTNIVTEGCECIISVTNISNETILLRINIPEEFNPATSLPVMSERLFPGGVRKYIVVAPHIKGTHKSFVFRFDIMDNTHVVDYYVFTVFVVDSEIIGEYESASANVGRYMIALIVMVFLWFIVGMDTFIAKIGKLSDWRKKRQK